MTRAPHPAAFAAIVAVSGLALLPSPKPAPWLVNETSSLPRGVYALTRARPAAGAIVAVTPPPRARPYLATLGAPAEARLLKHVAAGPGAWACHDGRRMRWARGEAEAHSRDRRGRPLPTWRGCRRLGPDELLLVGESPLSFDSRYFGPVKAAAVDGVYREVWRW